MTRLGMDVDAVEQAGRALQTDAAQIDTLIAKADALVRRLPALWQGTDARLFVDVWWPQHRAGLRAAEEGVRGLGQSALNNAAAQRSTSASVGANPSNPTSGTTTNGASGNPAPSTGDSNGGTSAAGPSAPGELAHWDEGSYREFEKNNLRWISTSDGGFWADRNGKAVDNCTAWAAWRRESLGLSAPTGNGGEMAANAGGTTDTTPSLGALVSTHEGTYGHVMVIEKINPDGTFVTSETNYGGTSAINERTWTRLPDGQWRASDGAIRELVISK